MTAMDHMRLFSRIKGVPEELIEEQSIAILKKLHLEDVKNAQAGSFSGGMKRRLSVAISCIGSPMILFFDEPTTGMDPVSRKSVWGLMQEMKREKTIILTTHAMEEADALSDRIAVVVDGQLKCIGTSINLKNTFGDGYNINLICEPGDESQVIELMDRIAPSNKLVDEAGGSLMFSVSLDAKTEIEPLFRLIEHSEENEPDTILDSPANSSDNTYNFNLSPNQDKDNDYELAQLKQIITDVGISHSTLEEVFMRVTGRKESKFKAKTQE